MALDPTIPLGVRPVAAPAQVNPFEMIGQWAQIQNAMNQNKLFQQTFAARQKAGMILANAPDLETGLSALMQDPITAPFAAETINSVRQGQLTLTQLQGAIQTQSKDGLEAFMKALPTVFADPTEDTWNGITNATLSTLSPQARARVEPAIGSLKRALMDGLPDDPAAKKATFGQRLTGMMLASGFTPDGIKQLVGTNKELDLGGAIQPGRTIPEQLGGGFAPSGPAYGKGLAPQIVTGPGGVPIPVGGENNLLGPVQANGLQPGVPQGAEPSGPINALGGTASSGPPVTAQPIAPPRTAPRLVPPAGMTGPNAGAFDAAPAPQAAAGDGTPLFDPAVPMRSPQTGTGVAGLPLLSPTQLKASEKLQDEFSGDGAKEYNNAVQSLSSLKYMDNALDAMAKKTSGFSDRFLTPGAFAESRANIASTYNTLAAMAGQWDPNKPISPDNKPPFDPATIASAEDFQKETKRMGLMVLTTFLGAQREAAQTIQGITASVPGINNTYLGGKLVSASIRGAMQRVVDRRQFLNQWQNQNSGNLTGAGEAFDRLHPAEQYAEHVLSQFGLNETGFKSPADARTAVQNGYLSPDQAADLLVKQFPNQFKKAK